MFVAKRGDCGSCDSMAVAGRRKVYSCRIGVRCATRKLENAVAAFSKCFAEREAESFGAASQYCEMHDVSVVWGLTFELSGGEAVRLNEGLDLALGHVPVRGS